MKIKLIGMFVCMLFFITNISVSGSVYINENNLQYQCESSKSLDVDWWPQFQHDPENTGFSTSTAPNNKNILWSYTEKNGGFVSPIVADGKVFVGSMGYRGNDFQGKIYCFNADNGELLWNFTPTGYELYAIPSYSNGKVFVGVCHWSNLHKGNWNELGDVYCLNADDGSLIWEYDGSIYVEGSISVIDEKVYVGGSVPDHGGLVLCLEADTGDEIWNSDVSNDFIRDPVCVSGDYVYFCSSGRNVYCLNALNGNKVWNYETIGAAHSAPTVVDGKVYFGSQGYSVSPGPDINGAVYCLDAVTGKELWKNQAKKFASVDASSPAIVDGRIYIGAIGLPFIQSGIRCLDATDGSIIWSRPTLGDVIKSPAVADGKLFIPSMSTFLGIFYCVDMSSGLVKWRYFEFGFWTMFSSPAVANGRIYVGLSRGGGVINHKGTLFCFGE